MVMATALCASLMTLLGGTVAMRAGARRYLVYALAGGLMVGVVLLDLLPESLEQAPVRVAGVPLALLAFAVGLVGIHLVASRAGRSPRIGLAAGSGMVLHSLMDGFAIGAAFRMGSGIGALVAIAVVAHDFADGFNAFTLTSLYGNARRRAQTVLCCDAAAPLAGAAIAGFVDVSSQLLGLYLGLFAGVLLYLALTDVLPEAHGGLRALLRRAPAGTGLSGGTAAPGTAAPGEAAGAVTARPARSAAALRRSAGSWALTAFGFCFVWAAVGYAG